jgi:hypothetical protein
VTSTAIGDRVILLHGIHVAYVAYVAYAAGRPAASIRRAASVGPYLTVGLLARRSAASPYRPLVLTAARPAARSVCN